MLYFSKVEWYFRVSMQNNLRNYIHKYLPLGDWCALFVKIWNKIRNKKNNLCSWSGVIDSRLTGKSAKILDDFV